ncbi:MAG: M18 family aminopeptidase, partial [Haliea sp.]
MTPQQFNSDLLAFLTEATTPFHAVAALVGRLEAAGFTRLPAAGEWNLQPGQCCYLTRNDSSLLAFTVGSDSAPETGMRMVGAHTDSPCLMVKPAPEKQRSGYFQLGVEVYGGALLNPWFDRDLSLAGRVSFADAEGALHTALVDFRRPLAVIPSLAIHLDREANQSRSINPQTDILPILALQADTSVPDFRSLLRQRLLEEHPDCGVDRVLDYELCFYDSQRPALVGLREEFVASARLDNLLSCFVGLQALLQSDRRRSCLLVCNDHEEVGSQSSSGAQGPMLLSTLRRIAGTEERLGQLVQNSMMISA